MIPPNTPHSLWSGPVWRAAAILVAIAVYVVVGAPAASHAQAVNRAVDMMLVIDNSCSMFPAGQIIPGCEVWGNDPTFLRIAGSNLFMARLGFAEPDEEAYQLGVVSLGDLPELVAPLQPLDPARDALARVIANPRPQLATRIIPALEAAYAELGGSPSRRPSNQPALVLITDGSPFPREGQSNEEIEQLVTRHPDVPIFIMLIQNNVDTQGDYEEYIQFWSDMQARHNHVFAYRITNNQQIEGAYNAIIAQLQSTTSTVEASVTPGERYDFFVSKYARKIWVTVIHRSPGERGVVTVTDPRGAEVVDGQIGVTIFRGDINPVEVIAVAAPRLDEGLKNDVWTVRANQEVSVFIDRQGVYRIQPLAPGVTLTDVPAVYVATEPQPPSRELLVRFSLVDENGGVITEPQQIAASLELPGGVFASVPLASPPQPDGEGVYELRLDPVALDPRLGAVPGRLTLTLSAGIADERTAQPLPIARARLLIDMVRAPYLAAVEPAALTCGAGGLNELRVAVVDADLARPGTVQVRVFGGNAEVTLDEQAAGQFAGDIAPLCRQAEQALACGDNGTTTLRLRLTAQLADGSAAAPIERPVSVQVRAAACPPTPMPTPTPPPPPPPPPLPCPERRGIPGLNGCPAPWWLVASLVAVLVTAGAFTWLWLIPTVRIQLNPPPRAFLKIKNQDSVGFERIYALHSVGRQFRVSTVRVGGDRRRAQIYVPGLAPVELSVANANGRVVVTQTNGSRLTLSDTHPTVLRSSNPAISLHLSTSSDRL